jgi:hypothetical protein
LVGPVAAAAAKAPPVVKAKLGEETWAQVHNGFHLDMPSTPYQCQPQLVNSLLDVGPSFRPQEQNIFATTYIAPDLKLMRQAAATDAFL